MKEIERDVQALLEGLKAVTGQIDSLIKRCDQLEGSEAGKKKEAKGKRKSSPRKPR